VRTLPYGVLRGSHPPCCVGIWGEVIACAGLIGRVQSGLEVDRLTLPAAATMG